MSVAAAKEKANLTAARDVDRADASAAVRVLGPGDAAPLEREADRIGGGGRENPDARRGEVDCADRPADAVHGEPVAERELGRGGGRDRRRSLRDAGRRVVPDEPQ